MVPCVKASLCALSTQHCLKCFLVKQVKFGRCSTEACQKLRSLSLEWVSGSDSAILGAFWGCYRPWLSKGTSSEGGFGIKAFGWRAHELF